MKALPSIVMALALAASAVASSEQTWNGKIADSLCGATHQKMAEHSTANISDGNCTLACIKKGGKYILISEGKVYNIANQDFAGLEKYAGDSVQVTGEMKGDVVKVSKIRPAGKAKSETD